jgi:hypothetical protein
VERQGSEPFKLNNQREAYHHVFVSCFRVCILTAVGMELGLWNWCTGTNRYASVGSACQVLPGIAAPLLVASHLGRSPAEFQGLGRTIFPVQLHSYTSDTIERAILN